MHSRNICLVPATVLDKEFLPRRQQFYDVFDRPRAMPAHHHLYVFGAWIKGRDARDRHSYRIQLNFVVHMTFSILTGEVFFIGMCGPWWPAHGTLAFGWLTRGLAWCRPNSFNYRPLFVLLCFLDGNKLPIAGISANFSCCHKNTLLS